MAGIDKPSGFVDADFNKNDTLILFRVTGVSID